MRVVGGRWRGQRLAEPRGRDVTRPTTDRVREACASMLESALPGGIEGARVLDAFAGSGAMGIELLSRGCGRVVSVERDAQHFKFIRQVVDALKAPNCTLLRADVFRFLNKCNETFDFIFADPPYALNNLATLPDLVFGHRLLKKNGLFVLEHGKTDNFTAHPCFVEHRAYGSVNFSFFREKEETAP